VSRAGYRWETIASMQRELTRCSTPEEKELAQKRAELNSLESQLAERELSLATLRAELNAFEGRYLRIVGARYAELDDIEAKIAEYMARSKPENRRAQRQAERAREQAHACADATRGADASEAEGEFRPSDTIKKLYREIARRLHPDLTTDPEEKERRNRIMAEATNGYERGDERRLRQILEEWETSPEAVEGEGPGAELVRVIRKIAQVGTRLRVIDEEITRLTESQLYELKTKVEEAAAQGTDLLQQMAANLDRQIEDAERRLADLE